MEWPYLKYRVLAWWDGFPDFAAYRQVLRQERMSPAEIEELRRRKTRHLVDQCIRYVPYYRDLLIQARISAENVSGPEDLERLPLLSKEIVRREGARLLSSAAAPGTYFPHTTGGSTGTPLDFYRGWEYSKIACTAAGMRALRRMGWRPGARMARLWASFEQEVGPRGAVGRLRRRVRRWLQPPDLLLDAYDCSEPAMEGSLARLREFRPEFLYGYGNNLVLLARFLSGRGVRLDCIRGVASTATALFPSGRRLLQEVFPRARVIDFYGSREVPGVAAECEHGIMHINSDLVHVEFLPAPERPGLHRLVVTALDNTVFPFIRYDIGDHGSPRPEPCDCGLPFPGMNWGYGKILDTFVAPDGRLLAGGFFEDLMFHIKGVHSYQFRQTAPEEIVLYVVPSDEIGDSTFAHFAQIERQIHEGFSAEIRLRTEIVDSIPTTPAGKHQFVVSELRDPSLSLQSGEVWGS